MSDRLTIVGIGADGWAGLGERARDAVLNARLLVGSARQLALVPDSTAQRRPWPSPIEPLVKELVSGATGPACILASGDPMLHGIGATLAARVEPARLKVFPHPSAFSLACARLAWPSADVELVSAVGRPADAVARLLQPGRRIVVYVAGTDGAAQIAAVLRDRGHGPSRFVVLEQLGGAGEHVSDSTAEAWGERTADPLHAVAVECRPEPGAPSLPLVPGLPDEVYASDGQLTKHHVRALTLAALAPLPGLLLWDVGAGSGSIGIEWLRAEPTARAIAVEADAVRSERVVFNARRLGVPALEVVTGRAPAALAGLRTPDAVFVGGGLTTPAMFDRCWAALRGGGRIVSNAVTLEGEQVLLAARAAHGGTLVRVEISHTDAVGRYTGWQAQRPVMQWSTTKEDA